MKKSLLILTIPAFIVGAFFLQSNATSADNSNEPELRILRFEADWCGPCQQMKPVFEKVSKNLGEKAQFETINVDVQPSLALQYNISGLPTVIALKDGKEVDRSLGYMNNLRLTGFVKKNL
ncbi:MAG: thioredoxin domain-containing protein [Verrucomicrobiota bacterium]